VAVKWCLGRVWSSFSLEGNTGLSLADGPTLNPARDGCHYISHISHHTTVKPVLSSHPRKARKWLLKAGGCLMEVNISTKLKFGNILFVCLRQVGCLIQVIATSGLTV